MDRPTCDL